MPSLLDLPDFLLEEVIEMAIRSFNFSVSYRSTPQMDRVVNGRFSVSLALLLTSRRVNALTTRILLLRGNFRVYTVRDLQRFFDMLEHGKLSFVRRINISLSNINSDKYFAEDTVTAENVFEQCISLINRLSSNLRELRLHRSLFDNHSFWDTNPAECNRVHRIFAEALQRFSDLETLVFSFDPHSLPLFLLFSPHDPIVESGATGYASIPERPMFPRLQALHLYGCLPAHTRSQHLIEVLSERNLPALLELNFCYILHHPQSNDGFEWILTPEVILNMHPLVEFRWVTVCDAPGFGNSVPHPPPTKDHLVALQKKHGRTLRWLIMQYGYWLHEIGEPATFVFTADDVETFLRDLDLERVVITVPHIDLCLAILMLAFERQPSFS
ncbi:predicted protein [Histoplasma capsulatum G186AR]|uniref:F-box domain-containing protein n=1 Tax=Ajellomyces capsulatus (strain G186AR / H82 / ATCC MYA-2454 / RMSCC 2432) TaxID=447093 RepID=C0NQ81_AJECG|nr:uncharacterized protein HCBG_05669 [Histoplasma capsulatum G186AR]EEH06353.1 predicted protein [Histoplasma capsulatum G186AR]